jgi:hypothetical protein
MATDRTFDVALLGATGFTGALTAVALAGRAPVDLRWALAGRNREKLEARARPSGPTSSTAIPSSRPAPPPGPATSSSSSSARCGQV